MDAIGLGFYKEELRKSNHTLRKRETELFEARSKVNQLNLENGKLSESLLRAAKEIDLLTSSLKKVEAISGVLREKRDRFKHEIIHLRSSLESCHAENRQLRIQVERDQLLLEKREAQIISLCTELARLNVDLSLRNELIRANSDLNSNFDAWTGYFIAKRVVPIGGGGTVLGVTLASVFPEASIPMLIIGYVVAGTLVPAIDRRNKENELTKCSLRHSALIDKIDCLKNQIVGNEIGILEEEVANLPMEEKQLYLEMLSLS